jgi:hypothetical protein
MDTMTQKARTVNRRNTLVEEPLEKTPATTEQTSTPAATPAQPKAPAPAAPRKSSRLVAKAPKSAEPSKPKILIYGKPGVGKTWTSLDFPRCYYIDTEDGANLAHYTDKLQRSNGVYMGQAEGSLDFKTVIDQVKALATEDHEYKTLIIDSISKLYNRVIADEQERLGDKDAFGASKKPAVAMMRQLVNWLCRLDMNVILIAHEKPLWGIDGSGQRAEIGVTFDAWDKLEYELHLALNIQKRGPSRVAVVKKSRLKEFADNSTFPWGFDDFAKIYGRDIIEAKGKVIVLATAESVAMVKKLLDVVKIADEDLQKWFTKAGASSFEEMTQAQVDKCIEHLKSKLA